MYDILSFDRQTHSSFLSNIHPFTENGKHAVPKQLVWDGEVNLFSFHISCTNVNRNLNCLFITVLCYCMTTSGRDLYQQEKL